MAKELQPDSPGRRSCLTCKKLFPSTSAGHRRCRKCERKLGDKTCGAPRSAGGTVYHNDKPHRVSED